MADDHIEAMERHARMQRINRIGRRTIICMLIIAGIAIAYSLTCWVQAFTFW